MRDQAGVRVGDQAGDLASRHPWMNVDVRDLAQGREVPGLEHRTHERDRATREGARKPPELLNIYPRLQAAHIQQARRRERGKPAGRWRQALPFGRRDPVRHHGMGTGRLDSVDDVGRDRHDAPPFCAQPAERLRVHRPPPAPRFGGGPVIPCVIRDRAGPAKISQAREQGVRGHDRRPFEALAPRGAPDAAFVSRVRPLHGPQVHRIVAP